jgi:hypothetical protein
VLPDVVKFIIGLADPDPGGQEAMQAARDKWSSEGRRVRIATPDEGDWNDELRSGRTISDLMEARGKKVRQVLDGDAVAA